MIPDVTIPSPRRTKFGGGIVVWSSQDERDEGRIASTDPRPSGPVRLGRPTLFWRVFPDVTEVALTVDERPVPAIYDQALRALVYRPGVPFAPGPHRLHADVVVSGRFRVSRDWEIVVLPGVPHQLGESISGNDAPLFTTSNELRRKLGLPLFSTDPALLAAARAHAAYLARGGDEGHFEREPASGFTGRRPIDRARTFGFVEDVVAEDVGLEIATGGGHGVAEGRAAVLNLFAAPYHRMPFLDPRLSLLGVGASVNQVSKQRIAAAVLVFGGSLLAGNAARTVVSPTDGERDVPVAWTSEEQPDPLRFFPHQGAAIGFPLVFAHFRPRLAGARRPIRLAAVSLSDPAGRSVPLWLNSPDRDEELRGEAAILLPQRPLEHGTLYRASVRAFDADGRDISRTWSFMTTPERRRPR